MAEQILHVAATLHLKSCPQARTTSKELPKAGQCLQDVSPFMKKLNLEAAELEPLPLRPPSKVTSSSGELGMEHSAMSSSMVGSVLSKVVPSQKHLNRHADLICHVQKLRSVQRNWGLPSL